MEPVALVGWAQTVHEAEKPHLNYTELAFEAVDALRTKLGLAPSAIETTISASSDFTDGRTISNMAIQDVVGAAGRSESKVSMDGAFALLYGWARVASGAYSNCLVVAHGKLSEGDAGLISNASWDPIMLRPLGFTDRAALGMQARRWLDARGLPAETLARAASTSWTRAAQNPHAHRREAASAAAIAASGAWADPLTRGMAAPDSDGAACVLLASRDAAARFPGPKIWLRGVGTCYDAHSPGARDLAESFALRTAAAEAYRRAGVTRPAQEIAIAETVDRSACQTLLWAEGLGLCAPERSADWLETPASAGYNASGGAMGANPGFATGLVRVAEAAERLAGAAGRKGVAHGCNGVLGQAHCVWVLEGGNA